jgi:hypothetical protein
VVDEAVAVVGGGVLGVLGSLEDKDLLTRNQICFTYDTTTRILRGCQKSFVGGKESAM